MYESFFGLACEPFSVAPDPRFLYLGEQHRLALQHLDHGLRHGGGFVLLTGEIGAGKTTVLRHFLTSLPGHFDVAFVVNPKLKVDALLARVCEDLHVPDVEAGALLDPIDALHGHLLLCYAQGRRALIVVDEAQALSHEVFEQLRLITNLVVTSDRKLVQVLLVGQPELRQMLTEPALEPLAQRVVARFHLPALPAQETARYIVHRLAVAGRQDGLLFEPDAIGRIHALCRGVPRRINVLCDRALVLTQARSRRTVDGDAVEQAAEDVFGTLLTNTAATPQHDFAGAEARTVPGAELEPEPAPTPRASASPPAAPSAAPPMAATAPAAPRAAAAIPRPLSGARSPSPVAGQHAGPRWAVAGLLCLGLAGAAWWLAGGRAPHGEAHDPATVLVSALQAASTGASDGMPARAAKEAATSAIDAVAEPAPPATADETAPARQVAAVTRSIAPSTSASAIGSAPSVADLAAVFATPRSEASAWRELATLWHVDLAAGDPCEAASAQGLQCQRLAGGLAPIRQLGRPGLLRLNDGQGRSVPVLLTALDERDAVLRYAGREHRVPLGLLAQHWDGRFATLWKAPSGYPVRDPASNAAGDLAGGAASDDGPLTAWLHEQLDKTEPALPAGRAATLAQRIFAFQLAHGLAPDGVAGPLTLMQLNRASGIDEPRLAAAR